MLQEVIKKGYRQCAKGGGKVSQAKHTTDRESESVNRETTKRSQARDFRFRLRTSESVERT